LICIKNNQRPFAYQKVSQLALDGFRDVRLMRKHRVAELLGPMRRCAMDASSKSAPSDQAIRLICSRPLTSAESLYRRFFTVKRSFSERERGFFLNVDFVGHE